MNKKVVIAIIVLLALVGGYFGYTKLKGGGSVTPGTATGNQDGSKSLKDLLTSGVAQKCTFSQTDESGISEGTTYVSGGKIRGDFTTTASGKVTKSHMISDGKTSYIWSEGEKNGFKMIVDESDSADTKTDNSNAPVSGEADLNQKADYKCSGWVVDGSFFTPPSSVTFSDLSQILNPSPAPSQESGSSSSQCSYCDSLSGDDKTQCRAALGCK